MEQSNELIPYQAFDSSTADNFETITHHSPSQTYVNMQKSYIKPLVIDLSIFNKWKFLRELNAKWLAKTGKKKMPYLKRSK